MMKPNKNLSEGGITLIELLLTVAIAAILGAAILYFLNPASQYAAARNNQRVTHINTLAGAVRSRITDNHGVFETNCVSGPLPGTTTTLGSGPGNYNIEPCLIPTYLSVMPLDPSNGTSSSTGYSIVYTSTTRQFVVGAPNAELGQTISVTR